ncbi:hypothetical protein GWK08_13115 [Leptobacterium flavescens]|uniref:Uncharacterized protein n=1 Tax=Leptobacterium flavescens TaxID=472055 RepID=A0A6P0UMZ1_9FLAO|nr:hypothetical protein [Leptobacterium flavescens]NER14387.1 hypothetical protein [Leptobacterium flavescens]
MSINTYEVLYIQALDNYPYNVEECIEKLQYVISANNEHTGAHYLLGRIYEEHLSDYKKARYHYEMALYLDHEYTPTYYSYTGFLIRLNLLEEAEKVIGIGMEIPGIDRASLWSLKGLLYEKYELYNAAIEVYKEAKLMALNADVTSDIDLQIRRVKDKTEQIKKMSGSKKGSTKKK